MLPPLGGGPQMLFRRLRETIVGPGTVQERLDRMVGLVASNMASQDSALFVQHADGSLELFAAKGVNANLAHRLILNPGEGIIGLVAAKGRPMALRDVWSHPNFSYHPEMGEKYCRSMLAVPIMRGGRILGALSIQNEAYRSYEEEDIETLQMASMVLGEVIVSGELQSLSRPGIQLAWNRPLCLKGIPLSEGIGLGYAVFHEVHLPMKTQVTEDVEGELKRLEKAIAHLHATMDYMVERSDIAYQGEHLDLLETVRMVAHDRRWLQQIRETVSSGVTAETAIAHVRAYVGTKIVHESSGSFHERLHDLDELTHRLIKALGDSSGPKKTLSGSTIIVARSMGTTTLLDYDRTRLCGLVLEEGGSTSHMAIMARAMNVPVVGGITHLRDALEPGDLIIVDGASGEVHIRPTPEIADSFRKRIYLQTQRNEHYRALRDVPCVSQDGVPISLNLNVGLQREMVSLKETSADGIGLFRTEFLFMAKDHLPTSREQVDVYRSIFESADGRSVTWRTWDLGGDKFLPFMKPLQEKNPALGWRAIRLGLDRPGLFRTQVRSILKAAGGQCVNIMFPMVASVDEFEQAKALVLRDLHYLEKMGHVPPSSLRLGVMLEVPSLLFQLSSLMQVVDFISVGSNDLLQFLFAVDRGNRKVSQRFDPLSRAPLAALKSIVDMGIQTHCPVTICGELASKPLGALVLIGLGYRSLSMAPSSIGPIKNMILGLNVGKISSFLKVLLEDTSKTAKPLRLALAGFAAAHGISE